MPMTPGLSPSIRQDQEEPAAGLGAGEDVIVEILSGEDKPNTDDKGNILRIEHDDGSISVSLDGRPMGGPSDAERAREWFGNLVDDIDSAELNRIADDLLKGVRDDLDSRNDWKIGRAHV